MEISNKPTHGIVRPGNVKPFKKCTKDEFEERVEKVAQMLVEQRTPGEIKRWLADEFGLMHRQRAVYIACARDWLAKRATMTNEQAEELIVNGILDAIRHGTIKNRLSAMALLADIKGLRVTKTELTGASGGPLDLLAGPRPLQHMTDADLMDLTSGKKIIKLEPAQLPEPQPKQGQPENGGTA